MDYPFEIIRTGGKRNIARIQYILLHVDRIQYILLHVDPTLVWTNHIVRLYLTSRRYCGL